MRSRLYPVALAAAFTLVAAPAFGQVTVGSYTSGNCFPLNCGSITRYQEIYSSSAFGSLPFLINTVGFFSIGTTSYNNEIASLTMGITHVAPGSIGLAGTNAYFGAATFFSGAFLSGPINNPVFGGTPYLYDPTLGNLILDWTLNGGTYDYTNGYMEANGGVSRTADGSCTVIGRAAYSAVEGDWAGCGALVTEFNGTNPVNVGSVTPEPATLALLGTGFLGLGLIRRRRRNPTA